MSAGLRRLAATALLAVAAALLIFAAPAADAGWVIERFASDIEVQRDGGLLVTEAIDVDFQLLGDRHGIFRDIPVRYQWDPDPRLVRVYQVNVQSVRDASGRGLKYETSQNGANLQIKIGDANKIVVGKQTYRITYSVRGALNAFADHDELFWNVNGGDWPVPMRAVTATVRTAFDAFTTATCFEGALGSKKACESSVAPQRASFSATTALPVGQQLTIVTALRKGAVTVPAPTRERRERDGPLGLRRLHHGDVFRRPARLQEAVPELGFAAARGVQRDDRATGGPAADARHRDTERRRHRSRADPGAPPARC